MLQRIISIRNVGRFKNCAAVGDVTFRRFTLIFAENGHGKTTLCDILRSLFTNMPAIIIGRTTLGTIEQPEVQLLTAAGNITFRNGIWNAPFPDVAVFDGTYVSQNVFAGDVVGTDHRRNLYRVIIGVAGVALAGRVTDLDEQVKAKTAAIQGNRAGLQRHLAPGITVEAFIASPVDPEIDAKIIAKEQDLQGVLRAAQLLQRAEITVVKVPVFPTAFAELLAKTFADVAADAEQRVTEHIAKHKMLDRGETWLAEGLRYVPDDECPFCGQNFTSVELIHAYRSYFSREYHALRDEVTALGRQVEGAIGEHISALVAQTVLQNNNSVEFWRDYCDIVPPPPLESAAQVMTALRESAQTLLRAKAGTPLEAVAPGDDFTRALSDFEALRASFGTYNAAVATTNAVIAARKRQVQAANAPDVENALARLRAQKVRHTDAVHELCTLDTRFQEEKAALEDAKRIAREQLDAHTQQVITLYGQSINRNLERINAGFRITTPRHTYRGGPPSTSYQILINQNAVDVGDSTTPADRPSFRNTLSAGDRSTLALAFFLAQLDNDANQAKKVVVFDDPFTSMDSFRRNYTMYQIYRCGQACAQVVVLSHEATFLKLLWARVDPADRKTLQLTRVGEENTTIAEWDIEKAVQARYRADIDTLQRFMSISDGVPMDVIQKLRPVLEGYCRNLYPTQFGEQEMIGSMVAKIRNVGAAHPLYLIVDDLDELNMYCRRYHHAENPNAATEPINDTELQGYVRRTLQLVGCLL